VTVVVIENHAVVLCHEEVGQAVAVVIADRYAHAIPAAADPGLFGYVSECSVAVVPVQRVAEGWLGVEEITLATVDQENVHPAVAVIIDECAPSAHSFR